MLEIPPFEATIAGHAPPKTSVRELKVRALVKKWAVAVGMYNTAEDEVDRIEATEAASDLETEIDAANGTPAQRVREAALADAESQLAMEIVQPKPNRARMGRLSELIRCLQTEEAFAALLGNSLAPVPADSGTIERAVNRVMAPEPHKPPPTPAPGSGSATE